MWQGALRGPDDQSRAAAAEAIDARRPLTVEILYTDQIGGQRTISRIGLIPTDDVWLASLNRHWYLDWDGPRPESLTKAAAEVVLRDHDAARQQRSAQEQLPSQPGGELLPHRDDLPTSFPPNAPSQTDPGEQSTAPPGGVSDGDG